MRGLVGVAKQPVWRKNEAGVYLPLWILRSDTNQPAWSEDPCAPECCPGGEPCPPCPPDDWASFFASLHPDCEGVQVRLCDTSLPPAGYSYTGSTWDIPCGTIVSQPSPRCVIASMFGCCEVTLTSRAVDASGCQCSASTTRDVNANCPAIQDCDLNDLTPPFAAVTLEGDINSQPFGCPPQGWCESLLGTFLVPKQAPGFYTALFNQSPAGCRCIVVFLEITVSIGCDGRIGATARTGTGQSCDPAVGITHHVCTINECFDGLGGQSECFAGSICRGQWSKMTVRL